MGFRLDEEGRGDSSSRFSKSRALTWCSIESIYGLATGNAFSILLMYYCLHLASSYKAVLLGKPCQVAINQFTRWLESLGMSIP